MTALIVCVQAQGSESVTVLQSVTVLAMLVTN